MDPRLEQRPSWKQRRRLHLAQRGTASTTTSQVRVREPWLLTGLAWSAARNRVRPFRWPIGAVFLAVVSASIMWTRLGSPVRNIAWAEDSGQFLEDRLTRGPFAVIFQPYDGYLHVVPRLIINAAVAARPIEQFATTVSIFTCLATGAVCALVFVLSRQYIAHWPLRVLLSLIPAITPLGPVEIAGNTANFHWYLLFLAPWLFAYRPRSWVTAATLTVLAALTTGTEIQTAVFLPLLLLNRRNRYAVPVAVVALLGITAQVMTTITHPRAPRGQVISLTNQVAGFLVQPFAGSFDAHTRTVSMSIATHGWWVVIVPAALLTATVVWAFLTANWQHRSMLLATIGGSAAVWFGALTLNGPPGTNWTTYTLQDWHATGPFRYAAAASMLLLAALVVTAEILLTRPQSARVAVAAVLLLSVVLAGAFNTRVATQRDTGPVWASQVQQQKTQCEDGQISSARIAAVPVIERWVATVPCVLIEDHTGAR